MLELAVAAAVVAMGILVLALRARDLWLIVTFIASSNPTGVPIPLGAPAAFSLATLLRTAQHLWHVLSNPVPLLLVGLSSVYMFSALWSPNPLGAINTGFSVIAVVAAITLAAYDTANLERLIRITMLCIAPIAIAQAIATIWFRFDPGVEDLYFHSAFFQTLLGADAQELFTTRRNNVTDPLKSGGLLFVNGNRASMTLAVWALMYLSVWIRSRNFWPLPLAILTFGAAITTGSKTAIILALIVPAVFLVLPWVIQTGRSPITTFLGVVMLGAFALGAARASDAISDTLVGAETSVEQRGAFAEAALKYFVNEPFLGLGFNGWTKAWSEDARDYGLDPSLPPHNFLIAGWANGGLLALILIVACCLTIFYKYMSAVRHATSRREGRALSVQLGVLAWMMAHAFYDNVDFYGVPNTLPIFAILMAQVLKPVVTEDNNASAGSNDFLMRPQAGARSQ